MPRYAYNAYSQTGELEAGELHAESDLAALDALTARGLKPVSLTAGGSAERWWQRDFSLTGGPAQADPAALEHFFKTLSSLLAVRFPLPRALRFCVAQARDRRMARALTLVHDAVGDGQSLAAAMRGAGGFFPDRLISMIEVGENANRLADVSARTAETLGAEAERRRELRAALLYPAILMVMSVMVMALLVFYLAPTLTPVFASASAEPPAILAAMTRLRAALIGGWPILLAGLLGLGLALRAAGTGLRAGLFRLGLRLPGIGAYLRQVHTLRICQTLALMLSSGAPLPRAVATARDAAAPHAYRAALATAHDAIIAGGTLSAPLHGNGLFDPMAVAMIEAAEETDQLSPVLDRLVADLRIRSSRSLTQAIRMITPVLTLAIGLGVGAVILSTVTAIMDLNDIAF